MKTKTILTYGAIAAGAYLAYKFLFKKNTSDANFANASGGGLLIPTSGTAQSSGSLILNQFNIWVDAYVRQNKLPSYIWKPCADMVKRNYYATQNPNVISPVLTKNSVQKMQNMFVDCVNKKLIQMQMQANLGSSSVRNTATM
jgi:hypothetical protein